jgi:hypothetical protein
MIPLRPQGRISDPWRVPITTDVVARFRLAV